VSSVYCNKSRELVGDVNDNGDATFSQRGLWARPIMLSAKLISLKRKGEGKVLLVIKHHAMKTYGGVEV
jgi:hypothetical protein